MASETSGASGADTMTGESAGGSTDSNLVRVDQEVLHDLNHELGNYFHKLYYWAEFIRAGDADMPPETAVCEQYGIEMIFDMGGNEKRDSSTRINQAMGIED